MLSKLQIKYIQSLGHKKFRDEEGLYIAEGPKIVKELINEIPGFIQSVYAVNEWISENQTQTDITGVIEITDVELARISQLSAPNKVLAVVRKFDDAVIRTNERLTLVLDTIQDPGNFGTIIRTADWFGISQVFCSPDSADMYNFKVVQSAMGSTARVNIQYSNLHEWLPQQEVKIYAAALEGKNIHLINPLKEGIILIGNESKGIDHDLLKMADEKITILRNGMAESLNAAVATGIILAQLTNKI